MLLLNNLQAYINNWDNRQAMLKQRKEKQTLMVIVICTLFQISGILFLVAMVLDSSVFRAIGFSFTSFLFTMCLLLYRYFSKKYQPQPIDRMQAQQAQSSITVLFITIISFFIFCAIDSLKRQYHYILCGTNSTSIFFCIIMFFKHPSIKFFLQTLSVSQIYLWIFYYYLNIIWGKNIHWGLTLYFSIICCAFCIFIIQAFKMQAAYILSIYLYFQIIDVILIWNPQPPMIELTCLFHIAYLITIVISIREFKYIKKYNIPQDKISYLKELSENVLTKSMKIYKELRINRPLQEQFVHQCRVCLVNSSEFGFDCGQNFYHFCICRQCVVAYCADHRGICLICGTNHNELFRIQKYKKWWIVSKKFTI